MLKRVASLVVGLLIGIAGVAVLYVPAIESRVDLTLLLAIGLLILAATLYAMRLTERTIDRDIDL